MSQSGTSTTNAIFEQYLKVLFSDNKSVREEILVNQPQCIWSYLVHPCLKCEQAERTRFCLISAPLLAPGSLAFPLIIMLTLAKEHKCQVSADRPQIHKNKRTKGEKMAANHCSIPPPPSLTLSLRDRPGRQLCKRLLDCCLWWRRGPSITLIDLSIRSALYCSSEKPPTACYARWMPLAKTIFGLPQSALWEDVVVSHRYVRGSGLLGWLGGLPPIDVTIPTFQIQNVSLFDNKTSIYTLISPILFREQLRNLGPYHRAWSSFN